MGRLIDTDELMERLCFENTQEERDMNCGEVITLDDIDDISTAYDVDKVVEQLEEERQHSHADFEQYAELHGIDTEEDWFYAGLKRAIEIVKRGGIDD